MFDVVFWTTLAFLHDVVGLADIAKLCAEGRKDVMDKLARVAVLEAGVMDASF